MRNFIIILLFLNFSFSSSYSLTFKDGKQVEEVSIEEQLEELENAMGSKDLLEKIDNLMDSFIKTAENGQTIDFELLSKKAGFDGILDAIKQYNTINNTNVNLNQLKDAFSFDRTRISYSSENFNNLYNIIISSNYKSGVRYREKYSNEPLNKAFAITMNLEKELAKLSKDPNMKEITAHTWTWWRGASDIPLMIDDLLEHCKNEIIKYKIPFQKCYVIDVNGENFFYDFFEEYIKNDTREIKKRN